MRKLHGSPGLTFNRPLAKAAQAYLKDKLGSCGSLNTFKGSTKSDRPYKYQDCSENYYTAIDSDKLMATEVATQQWIDGQGYWDFNKGAPFEGYEAAK